MLSTYCQVIQSQKDESWSGLGVGFRTGSGAGNSGVSRAQVWVEGRPFCFLRIILCNCILFSRNDLIGQYRCRCTTVE